MRPRLFALLAATAILVTAAGLFTLARGEETADNSPTSVSEHPRGSGGSADGARLARDADAVRS